MRGRVGLLQRQLRHNMRTLCLFWGIVLWLGFTASAEAVYGEYPAATQPQDTVILQGLDKVTARRFSLKAGLKEPIQFGSLYIVVRAVYTTPPEDAPETVAFLDITEQLENGEMVKVFEGWMFASSPAISALEHPVYDIWIKP